MMGCSDVACFAAKSVYSVGDLLQMKPVERANSPFVGCKVIMVQMLVSLPAAQARDVKLISKNRENINFSREGGHALYSSELSSVPGSSRPGGSFYCHNSSVRMSFEFAEK